jgi:hypothetical protein
MLYLAYALAWIIGLRLGYIDARLEAKLARKIRLSKLLQIMVPDDMPAALDELADRQSRTLEPRWLQWCVRPFSRP